MLWREMQEKLVAAGYVNENGSETMRVYRAPKAKRKKLSHPNTVIIDQSERWLNREVPPEDVETILAELREIGVEDA